jgi:hypothetical protein
VATCAGVIEPEVVSRPRWVPIHRVLRDNGGKWSDLTGDEHEEMLFGESTFRFTSVRNPYERLVSCYLNKIADGRQYPLAFRLRRKGEVTMLSFLKFVADQPPLERDVHCRAMVDLCFSGRVKYTDIVRYESFEDDLRRILKELGMADLAIPEPKGANRTDAGAHVHELLGLEECALIRSIYERDFDEFGYSRDIADVGRLT